MSGRDLAGFSGSAEWFRHPLVRSVLYLEGARYVFRTAGAHCWLLDQDRLGRGVASKRQALAGLGSLKVDAGTLIRRTDGNGRILHRNAQARRFP